jgi:hypothetical protein
MRCLRCRLGSRSHAPTPAFFAEEPRSNLADDPELIGLSRDPPVAADENNEDELKIEGIHGPGDGGAGGSRGTGDPVWGLAAFDSLSAVPQVDPLQARPEATVDEHGTPVVRLRLTGQDDTPVWRAINNEIAAKDDCPAEIDGPEGAPVLLVYLTDTSTDAAISSVLDRASFEHLHKVNTSIFLRPPEAPTSRASKVHIGRHQVKDMPDIDWSVHAWWLRWLRDHPEPDRYRFAARRVATRLEGFTLTPK